MKSDTLNRSIAAVERNIETLQALMSMLIDAASFELDEDATSDLAYTLMEAADDLHGLPVEVCVKLVNEDGSGPGKRIRVSFSVTVEDIEAQS